MMLQTTHLKVVIVGAALRAKRDTRTAVTFNDLLDARAFIELPATVSTDDLSSAGFGVFEQVKRLIGESDRRLPNRSKSRPGLEIFAILD